MSSVNKTSTSKEAENTPNHSIQTEPTSTTDDDGYMDIQTQTATKFEEEFTKTIDLNDIQAPADLAELRKKDPFMYHSIPAVRANVMQGTEVDVSTLAASAETPVVRRRGRISYESSDCTMPSEEMMRQSINEAEAQRQSESSTAEANEASQ